MRVSRVAFQEVRKQAKAACQAGVGNATKWVSMEGCRKGKRDQPILWGFVQGGADFKEAFLEELMSKLRAEAPVGGKGVGQRRGNCREEKGCRKDLGKFKIGAGQGVAHRRQGSSGWLRYGFWREVRQET